jgi:two-component system, NtrC family, response regulator AtoC
MSRRNHILIAEDEPEVRNFLRLALRSEDYTVEFVEDGEEVLSYLNTNGAGLSLLMLDILMPRRDGMETLQEVRKHYPSLPVIMMSGLTSPLAIVDAMKRGANDFLAKPVEHELLRATILKTIGSAAMQPAGENGEEAYELADFVSADSWSKKLSDLLENVSASDVPVLLQGETGVGKEMLARQIHAGSLRAHKPFLKINCVALPAELVESELFGYDRGAFTGAFKNNPGKFEMANGGTILLDEIGDMDVRLQAKLLQVLQDNEFIRLGSKESTRVDVRVIAATHCNLEDAIVNGQFREDLYYRLNVVNIVIPPLRERKSEILPLAEYFLLKHGPRGVKPPEILPVLKDALLNHDWPGNIRELENVLRRFLVIRNAASIADELYQKTRRHKPPVHATAACEDSQKLPATAGLPATLPAAPPFSSTGESAPLAQGVLGKMDEDWRKAETHAIMAALNRSLWNRKQAATLLDVDYKALLYKMKKLGIGERQDSLR